MGLPFKIKRAVFSRIARITRRTTVEVSGDSSGLATALGLKVDKTTTINGLDLSTNRNLTQDDIGDGTTNKQYSATDKAKVGHISITQDVDLDDIETRVNLLDAAVVLKGDWDASSGVFPGGGTAKNGWSYINSNLGEITIDGIKFNKFDRIVALVNNASTTVYSPNWLKLDYTDNVLSVAGKVGSVTLNTNDVAASTDKNYVTDADLVDIGNLSGVNSGNETGATIATLLHAASNKSAIVDADEVGGTDSANSFSLIRTTWTNVKAFLKTYFDTLYAAINNPTVTGKLSIKTTGTSFFHYIKSNSATVASAATIDLDLTEAGAGILTVYSARISNATYRTATVYFIFLRYGSWTLTSISTANGPSGSAAFTVTNPSDNIVRVTNNAGEDVILALSFSGTMGG